MRRLFLLAVVLAAAACASDKARVANAEAEWTYLDAEFQHECIDFPDGPEWCEANGDALDEADRQIQIANRVYKIGKLPPEERKAMKAALKKARTK